MTKQILLTLLNCSWQWGLLGGLTWLITRRFRRDNSTTHLLWFLFLLSLPILFVLNQFVPALSISHTVPELTKAQPVEISDLTMQTADLTENLLTERTADLTEVLLTESNTHSQGQTVIGSTFFSNWTTTDLILCIWTIGIFAMLIRLVFGLFRIHRFRCTATGADVSYQAICKRLAQKLNINRPVTVCFSDRVVSPISFGWLSPSILIPRTLNLEQFELVVAHELAHVQRLDWLTNLFSHVVGAIFFFHPIYYFLNRKLVHLSEQICDDWVIQLTGAKKKYAQCLLDLVRHENRVIPLVLTLNQPSQLESRIDSILKHNSGFDLKPKRRLLILAASLLIICLPLLSTAQLMPLRTVQLSLFGQTSDEPEKADEKVEKKLHEQKKMMKMNQEKLMQIDREGVKREVEPDRDRNPSPEEHIKRDGDEKANPEDKQIERKDERERKRTLSAEELVKQSDKDGNGNQENVTIPDANLATVVREALGLDPNAPIPKKKLEALEILQALDKDIGDLTGLEKATGLKTLIIRGAHDQKIIRDITPLAGLTQLTKLCLQGNKIKDIKPLAGLTQLTDLKLHNNSLIRDITPLANLKQLIHLSLWSNLISDITPLAELTQLKILQIFDNEISDITPLANLKQLTHLDISINEISDITPITNLKQLTDLGLQANRIHDITPLTNLKQLTALTLNKNKIRGIAPLNGLRQLTRLWLSDNQISDITPLSELRQLTRLRLSDNQISDITPLYNLTQLTSIKLSNNPINIRDMEPLRLLFKQQPDLEIDIAIPPAKERNRFRTDHVEVKNPAEFKKEQDKVVFSGPQPGQKLPPLKATVINGEVKGESFDFIAKSDGQPLVLILQDETPLGIRGLVGITRLLTQVADKSKQKFHVQVVFLGDSPDTLAEQVSKIVSQVPNYVLLGISPDGREGPENYELNRNVAQTILIVKDGKVLYNFALKQPMLSPDPYVIGAVGELIGEKPTTLEKWLNLKTPVVEIKKPAEGEENGKMLLNGTFILNGNVVHLDGTVVQFDELLTFLRNLPEERKSALIISSEPDVPHEQIAKVMDLAKEAGIGKIGFAISKNGENPIIDIKNPSEGEETGKMFLNGIVVQFDKLLTFFLNLPEEQKSTLRIRSGRDVSHNQVFKVIDIAKEAGIEEIALVLSPAEDKSMESDKAQEDRSKDPVEAPSEQTKATKYFPHDIGSTWVYEDQDGNELTRRAIEAKEIGKPHLAFSYEPALEDPTAYSPYIYPSLYHISDFGIRLLKGEAVEKSIKAHLTKEMEFFTSDPGAAIIGIGAELDIKVQGHKFLLMLPDTLVADMTWGVNQIQASIKIETPIKSPFDSTEVINTIDFTITEIGKVLGTETVGIFEDCLKVEYRTRTRAVIAPTPDLQVAVKPPGETVTTVWFAPNIGMVKIHQERQHIFFEMIPETDDSFIAIPTLQPKTLELKKYEIRKSDNKGQ